MSRLSEENVDPTRGNIYKHREVEIWSNYSKAVIFVMKIRKYSFWDDEKLVLYLSPSD